MLPLNFAEVEKELEKNSAKKPPPMLPTKRKEDKKNGKVGQTCQIR